MNKNEVIRIIDAINEISQLSITEEDILDSIFNLFSANKTEKIKQLEYLLNDETDSLLQYLNQREVINYVTDNHGFISEDNESGLVDALKDLDYEFIDEVKDRNMVKHLENSGYTITDYETDEDSYDIVTQSDLDELVYNFLSADFEKRKLMLAI